jgi:hypothetical protein
MATGYPHLAPSSRADMAQPPATTDPASSLRELGASDTGAMSEVRR